MPSISGGSDVVMAGSVAFSVNRSSNVKAKAS